MTRLRLSRVSTAILPFLATQPLLATPPPQDDGTWSHVGVGGGGFMTDVAFDPRVGHEGTMYVGSDVTGLFKSTDCGFTWSSSRWGLSDDYVQSIAVSPGTGALFVATLAGISRMEDNDAPWEDGGPEWETVHELPLSPDPDDLVAWSTVEVDPIDPSVVWAGVGSFRHTKGGPGGDVTWEHPHVWRSEDGGDTWTALPRICPGNENDPDCLGGDVPGVHSIVLDPLDTDPVHPGADRVFVSTTVGVWGAAWVGQLSQWFWFPYSDGLPHENCRDLEASYANDTIETLYLAIDSEWDGIDPYSVLDHESGFGGGVWVRPLVGGSVWSPRNDGLELFDGQSESGVPVRPKTIRHLAIDHDTGAVYTALTGEFGAAGQVSRYNEGVWGSPDLESGQPWTRRSETRCNGNADPDVPRVDLDWYRQLGPIDGLGVKPVSGDVFFTTGSQLFRSPFTPCGVGLEDADWQPIHTQVLEVVDDHCPPDLYSTNGMDVTTATYLMADPQQSSTWFVSYHDQGLARSDDSGATWDVLKSAQTLDFVAYPGQTSDELEKGNAEGMHRNPDPQIEEWLGVYRKRTGLGTPVTYKLYVTQANPTSASTWYQQDLGIGEVTRIHDLLFVDSANVLVATDLGVYRGTRHPSPGSENDRWMFDLDDRTLPTTFSRHATKIVAQGGTAHDRTVWVAFRKETSQEGGHDGGVAYGQALGTSWTVGTTTGSGTFTNVLCLARGTDGTVYAGNGSTRVGPAGVGAVWKSIPGTPGVPVGAVWSLACSTFSATGDPIDAYDPNDFDVVGLAVLNLPLGNPQQGGPTTFDRVYAALTPRGEAAPGPSYQGEVWGGVFASDNGSVTFERRLEGLNAGHSSFLRADPNAPYTLFYGTQGNGAYVMVEALPEGTGGGPGVGY